MGHRVGADATRVSFRLPLSALLSQLLVAFTTEFEEGLSAAGHAELSLPLGSNVLRFLDSEHGLRVGELAELAGVTKQAISQQVTHLQRIGEVENGPDPQDGRAKVVRLTAQGVATRDLCRPLFGTIERRWTERHGNETVAALRDAMERIASKLDDDLPHFPT